MIGEIKSANDRVRLRQHEAERAAALGTSGIFIFQPSGAQAVPRPANFRLNDSEFIGISWHRRATTYPRACQAYRAPIADARALRGAMCIPILRN